MPSPAPSPVQWEAITQQPQLQPCSEGVSLVARVAQGAVEAGGKVMGRAVGTGVLGAEMAAPDPVSTAAEGVGDLPAGDQ